MCEHYISSNATTANKSIDQSSFNLFIIIFLYFMVLCCGTVPIDLKFHTNAIHGVRAQLMKTDVYLYYGLRRPFSSVCNGLVAVPDNIRSIVMVFFLYRIGGE